ncbi:glutamate racemase [Erysipelothrix anatis]|uniref:glutamate racemase n=1 Tax=Erysipelothrix anatis TaxID=2683713 RepID=UPI00135CAD2E|nr:aspartate/glutamate racemase family protein [Erysipelothrix anatis]
MMRNNKTIGLFDSGLGGYSVFQYLKTHLPSLNLVLYADQKNAPYGNQSDQAIIEHTIHAMAWFEAQGITDIVIACNTVSSIAMAAISKVYPALNIMGIIDLTTSQMTGTNDTVAVVSTLATHRSKAYTKSLHARGIYNVVSLPLVDLVSYIENMEDPSEYLQKALEPIQEETTLILGCTHYPLILDIFEHFFNGDIVDSREPIYKALKHYESNQIGSIRVVTSGNPAIMREQIKALFLEDVEVEGV